MPANSGRVTLRDVAAVSRVSIATVSNVLNNRFGVAPETRVRVEAAVRRLGYARVPPLTADRPRCVAIAHAERQSPAMSSHTFYSLVLQAIAGVLEERHFTMRLMRVSEAAGLAARPSRNGDHVDGVIVFNAQDPGLVESIAAGVPTVAVDGSGMHRQVASVDNDDSGGIALGVRHLIDLGHRAIGLLGVDIAEPFGQQTLLGYLRAHEERSLLVDPAQIRSTCIGVVEGKIATAELIAARPALTGIVAVSDDLAVGAIQAITEAGRRVPDDISVVGMDDIPLATATRPRLTTVRVNLSELGRNAAQLLLAMIDGSVGDTRRLVLPTELVVRESSGPPPKSTR